MARPGPGNGWRFTTAGRHAELAAERPSPSSLNQLAQRLDQLHVHARAGQAADIVVALGS